MMLRMGCVGGYAGKGLLMLTMLVYCGKDWEHVGRGLAADAHDASLVWACLGVGVCGGGVWVVTREKGWPLMLTMLVYCGKDWEHVGRGLAADAYDASLVSACLGVGVCGGGRVGGHAGKGLATDADDAGLLWEGLGTCGKRTGR